MTATSSTGRSAATRFSHGAWLDEDALLRDVHSLHGIPGVLIHGRLDLSSPLDTAWRLARHWPSARLDIIDDSGHTGSRSMSERVLAALDEFAET